MKADLRGKHDLGAIVGYSYRVYFANFRALFLIALIAAPLVMLSAVVDRQIADADVSQTVVALFQFPETLVTLVATASLVNAVHAISGGGAPVPNEAIDAGLQRFGAMLSTFLLTIVLVVGAMAAFPVLTVWWLIKRDATIDGRRDWWLVLIPFALVIYLAVRWGFFNQTVNIQGATRWSALDASARLVRDNWWRVLGIMLVVTLIQLGPVLIASSSAAAPPLVEATVTGLATALVLPFAIIGQTLLYYDLNARRAIDAGTT